MRELKLKDNEAALIFRADEIDMSLAERPEDKDNVQTILCVATAKYLRDNVLKDPERTKDFIDKLVDDLTEKKETKE
jgi:hypothetical protein